MARINAGDRFPQMTVDTAYRKNVNIYELLGDKTVIWVLRYIGCTVCHFDVHLAQQRYAEITERNAKILFVMQSSPENLCKAYPEGSLPFDIISDPELKIYKALDIIPAESMEALQGNKALELQEKAAKAEAAGFSHGEYEGIEEQLPAMFILDRDGTVSYAKYAENIMDLPNFDDVLKLLS